MVATLGESKARERNTGGKDREKRKSPVPRSHIGPATGMVWILGKQRERYYEKESTKHHSVCTCTASTLEPSVALKWGEMIQAH